MKLKLLNEDSTINANSPLAGDEWTTAEIDWRYFSSVAQPSLVSRTEEGSAENTNDQDYRPLQKNSRTLCQATRRGTLIDSLNESERESENHAFHRNLVSAERRAQMEYEKNVRPLIVRRDMDFFREWFRKG